MQLTILGKYGPYGKAGVGAASGYLIEDGDFKMLCDMGSGVLSRLIAKVDIKTLDGIFISHLHYDHTSDMLPFRYLLDELQHPINIYTRYEDSEWYRILFDHPLFKVINIDEGDTVEIKGVKLEFFDLIHSIPNLAVKFTGSKTLLYTGDTGDADGVVAAGKGCDLILADCSKPEKFIGVHISADKAAYIQEKTGATLITTHLAPDYSPESVVAGHDKISVAEEGKTYII